MALAARLPGEGRDDPEVQACLGNAAAALDVIERSERTKTDFLPLFVRGPLLCERLAAEPRLQALLARLELPR